MNCRIIASGSKGNAILYEYVLVDCGVPYSKLKPYAERIKLVLLTHEHKDHFNLRTLKELSKHAKIVCSHNMKRFLDGIEHIALDTNKWYSFGSVKLSPFVLYHDVENVGWRIEINGKKVFHATDTSTLVGLTAKDYDVYGIEANHSLLEIEDQIEKASMKRQYTYKIGAKESHLSIEKAIDFLVENANVKSRIEFLHCSSDFDPIEYKDERIKYENNRFKITRIEI